MLEPTARTFAAPSRCSPWMRENASHRSRSAEPRRRHFSPHRRPCHRAGEAGHAVGLICNSLERRGAAGRADRGARGRADRSARCELPMRRSIGPGDLPAPLTVARHLPRWQPGCRACARRQGRRLRPLGGRDRAAQGPHGRRLLRAAWRQPALRPGSLSGRIYFTVERALERLTDGLIHVSAYEAETYRRKVGVPRCPAHVVRNGLRTGRVRARRAAPDRGRFPLSSAMLRDLKGVDVFIEALASFGRRRAHLPRRDRRAGDRPRSSSLPRAGERAPARTPGSPSISLCRRGRPSPSRAPSSCLPRALNRCPISCSRRRRPASRSSPPMSGASRKSSTGETERLVPPGDAERARRGNARRARGARRMASRRCCGGSA